MRRIHRQFPGQFQSPQVEQPVFLLLAILLQPAQMITPVLPAMEVKSTSFLPMAACQLPT